MYNTMVVQDGKKKDLTWIWVTTAIVVSLAILGLMIFCLRKRSQKSEKHGSVVSGSSINKTYYTHSSSIQGLDQSQEEESKV